jgi:hypothetical protein
MDLKLNKIQMKKYIITHFLDKINYFFYFFYLYFFYQKSFFIIIFYLIFYYTRKNLFIKEINKFLKILIY